VEALTREVLMANLIESIDNLLVEYISNPVIYLRDYLKLSDADKGREVANRFPWLFKEWFERLTDSWAEPIQLEFDADDGNGLIRYLLSSGFDWTFETFYREEQDAFDWGVQGILSKFVSRMHTPRDPGERKQAGKNLVKAPTFLHMKFVRLVKNDWLIHFSDHANSIHESGFKYGVRDLTKLGITTRLDKHMLQGEGYNFAFLADEAEQGASAGFTSWKSSGDLLGSNCSRYCLS